MALIRSRAGAANMAPILMVVAFLSIGLFVWWLSATAEPTEVVIVEEVVDEAAAEGAVAWADFGADPESFAGQEITIPGVQVASLLGGQAFWAQLPSETPYLIKLGDDLVAGGVSVTSGDAGDITGTVHMMSDSVLNAWEAAGAFTDPVNRIEAEFATSFFEAQAIMVGPPEGS